MRLTHHSWTDVTTPHTVLVLQERGRSSLQWRHNRKFKGQTYVCKHVHVCARVSLIPSGSSSWCQKLAIDGGVAERWSASWPWLGGRSLPRWTLTHIATSISFTRSWLSVTPVSARQHCSRDSARGDSRSSFMSTVGKVTRYEIVILRVDSG